MEKDKDMEHIRKAGQRLSDDRDKLADAVVEQNARMDRMEARANGEDDQTRDARADAVVEQDARMDRIEARALLNRDTYGDIVAAAIKVRENSDKLRSDVDDLVTRVTALEEYVAE